MVTLEHPLPPTAPSHARKSAPGIVAAPPAQADGKIMLVDDEPLNIKLARKFLSLAGHTHFVEVTDATDVLAVLDREQPDLLVLDIMMPVVSGLDVLEKLRAQARYAALPVLILTASDDREMKSRALNLGATDFLLKPLDPLELIPRVRNALIVKAHHDHLQNQARELESMVRLRTAELMESRRDVIFCLARAAEYRDNDTGRHILRVGRYVGIIARKLGLEERTVELFGQAALLHDVGKIGIPDVILLKPGKLDPDEIEIMQRHCGFGKRIFERMSADEFGTYATHTTVGANIFTNTRAPVLEVAGRIALTHHEKWDGSGYPLGLAAEHIPLEGRITAVADVFDALSSRRPYKQAFPLEKCFAIMEEGRGKHFDPKILDAFLDRRDEIVSVQISYADVE